MYPTNLPAKSERPSLDALKRHSGKPMPSAQPPASPWSRCDRVAGCYAATRRPTAWAEGPSALAEVMGKGAWIFVARREGVGHRGRSGLCRSSGKAAEIVETEEVGERGGRQRAATFRERSRTGLPAGPRAPERPQPLVAHGRHSFTRRHSLLSRSTDLGLGTIAKHSLIAERVRTAAALALSYCASRRLMPASHA